MSERREVSDLLTCTGCGRSHDGGPTRAWYMKRGKDPRDIKLCTMCFCDALGDLFDEVEEDNVDAE